jgi:hypothetical protein
MRGIVCFAFLAAIGCEKSDLKSPSGAFQDMAECIDDADARCLYDKLDRDSRWSIQTIHQYLKEASSLVKKSYPADKRQNAYGSWREEAFASDPEAVFETWCLKRRCLEQVAKGFGAIVKTTTIKPDNVVVKTTRGHSFPLFFAEGRWGLSLFREELQKGKLRALDRIEQVRKNAAEYEEQRLAVGSGEPVHEETKGE